MKKFIILSLLLLGISVNAQVGIGTPTPDSSAVMDVESDSKGFLPPRLTSSQRSGITNPAKGLLIFNTDLNCLENFTGVFWRNLCDSSRSAHPNPNLTVANVTYQGESLIDNVGIGYNGEEIPAASTITVELTNTSSSEAQNYFLQATDPNSGLQYSAEGTIAEGASGVPIMLTPNDVTMPELIAGTLTMPVLGVNNTLNLEPRIDIKTMPAIDTEVVPITITNGTNTQTWMDRNLGARRAATSTDDRFSFGGLYQWGRPSDGHEIMVYNGDNPALSGESFVTPVTGVTTAADLAQTDTPTGLGFILNFASGGPANNDWRSDNNVNRWATNNQGPCPAGYHVPSEAELTTAASIVALDNSANAFSSDLKFPGTGIRDEETFTTLPGAVVLQTTSSSLGLTFNRIHLVSFGGGFVDSKRASSFTVRCIAD